MTTPLGAASLVSDYLEHLIVTTGTCHHLDRDLLTDTGVLHLPVVHLHGEDLLRKIRGATQNVDLVSHVQLPFVHVYDGDAWFLKVVRDPANELFRHDASMQRLANISLSPQQRSLPSRNITSRTALSPLGQGTRRPGEVHYVGRMRIPGPLHVGKFVARPNRFLAVVELDGRQVEAHLPDPGRLKELLVPGRQVWVRRVPAANRRTSYTLTLVRTPSGEMVSLVTTFPNEMVAEALAAQHIEELSHWTTIRREYTWGKSRFDFLLGKGDDERLLLEVKSVTLVEGDRALFPDAVTARGARHVRELAAATSEGMDAAVLFVVQRRDAASITAARSIDPVFADALAEAHEAGVLLLGYRCNVTTRKAELTRPIPVLID